MNLKPGQKVQLKYTGEIGEVVSYPEAGIVQVLLEADKIKIPVNTEDLIEINSREDIVEVFQPVKHGKQDLLPDERLISFPKSVLTNIGVYLSFYPFRNKYSEITHFDLYIINDTAIDILYDFELLESNEISPENGLLKSASAYILGKFYKEMIEEHKTIILKVSQILTSGPERYETQTIKLKPKSFFGSEDFAPLLDKLSYLIKFIPDKQKNTGTEELKKLAAENIKLNKKPENQVKFVPHTDPLRLSEFSNELDLHISALIPTGEKLPPEQLFHLQMSVFDRYLADAIRLGVDRVFIIHGIGSGRLKNAIAKRLDYNHYVSEYKNEFHPAYGFGATEIRFN